MGVVCMVAFVRYKQRRQAIIGSEGCEDAVDALLSFQLFTQQPDTP